MTRRRNKARLMNILQEKRSNVTVPFLILKNYCSHVKMFTLSKGKLLLFFQCRYNGVDNWRAKSRWQHLKYFVYAEDEWLQLEKAGKKIRSCDTEVHENCECGNISSKCPSWCHDEIARVGVYCLLSSLVAHRVASAYTDRLTRPFYDTLRVWA